MGKTRTYYIRGKRNNEINTNVSEKLRTTVLLGFLSDGTKLPPLIILKNTKISPPSNLYHLHSTCFQNSALWISNEILRKWLVQL